MEKNNLKIKREMMSSMKMAVLYSSRGGGFLLSAIGVFLVQSIHLYLAFTIVTPFTNPWLVALVCGSGSIFLSGALLYFVSRATKENKEAQRSVELFTNFEIALGLIFYLDKLILRHFRGGGSFSELDFAGILMGFLLAIFIPLAIKRYATQVRALEPIDGEKHNLSKADMLCLREDLESIVSEKLSELEMDFEINKIIELQNRYEEQLKVTSEKINQEKMKLVSETLDLKLQANIEFLKRFSETLSSSLTAKSDSLVEIVTQKSVSKATIQLTGFISTMANNLISEEKITSEIIAKIQTEEFNNDQIDNLKKNINNIKNELDKKVDFGDNDIEFKVKNGGLFEDKLFNAKIIKK